MGIEKTLRPIYYIAENRLNSVETDRPYWWAIYNLAAYGLGLIHVGDDDMEWALTRAKELGYTEGPPKEPWQLHEPKKG